MNAGQHGHLLNYVQLHKKPLYVIVQRYRTPNSDKLSESTIRRILHTNGIRSCIAAVKPYLSTNHIAALLQCCAERENTGQHKNGMQSVSTMSHFLRYAQSKIIHVYGEKQGNVMKAATLYPHSNPVMHRCAYGECITALDAVRLYAFSEI